MMQGVFMSVGYPGDLENQPEAIRAKELAPRERYLQQEFIRNSIF